MTNDEVGGNIRSTARARRRVLAAVLAGTTLEWYDFFIYSLAAALILDHAFFPSSEPGVGALAAFATVGAGFVVRPLAGVLIGHLGDRYGRKPMLLGTVWLMGCSTIAIGLLPTYAAIGVWAPVLLVGLRLLQGFAVGGEWGGSALMSVEHAPRGRKAFYGSFTQVAVPVGYVLASLAFLAVQGLPDEQLRSWGWRIPFLVSSVVVAVALFLRRSVDESPQFRQMRRDDARPARLPVLEVLRTHPRAVLLTIGVTLATSTHSYLGKVYLLSYATRQVHVPTGQMLAITAIASGLAIVFVPAAAWLSDRVGQRRVFIAGAVGMAVWIVPLFVLVNTGNLAVITVAKIVAEVFGAAVYAPLAAILAASFAVKVRYTGVSIGYQVAAILGGGFAPFIAAAFFQATGSWTSVAAYYFLVVLISLVSMVFLRTRPDEDELNEPLYQPATTRD